MAKTKYIVPAVAMLLCAVSLIGAGYAAYSATLQDSETASVDNNYITLTLGSRTVESEVDVYYEYNIVYSAGTETSREYIPYLGINTATDATGQALLGSFRIAADVANIGSEKTSTACTLSLTNASVTGLTGAVFKIYSTVTEGVYSGEITQVNYNTTFYVVLEYVQDGSTDVKTEAPGATLPVAYKLNAEAILANVA